MKISEIFFSLVIIAIPLSLIGFCIYEKHHIKTTEKTYCGPVVERFMEPAYKSSTKAHVVFYNQELRCNINVNVSWNTYANTSLGKDVCFVLDENDLR